MALHTGLKVSQRTRKRTIIFLSRESQNSWEHYFMRGKLHAGQKFLRKLWHGRKRRPANSIKKENMRKAKQSVAMTKGIESPKTLPVFLNHLHHTAPI